MKVIFFFLLVSFTTLGSLIIISCSGADEQNNDAPVIPDEIMVKADQVVISKTGKEFFDKYITGDPEETKIIPQGYFISYRFYIPERPYVDEKITFALDSSGVVRKDITVTGIPDCLSSADNCSFLIDESEAREIAAKAGLEKGIKDWGATFMWNAEYNKYTWHILSTLKGSEGPDGFRGSGKELVIDPNSGEILKENEWNVR